MDPINIHRRKWLALGGVAMGMAMLPRQALATLSTPRPRILVLNNLNTGEQLKAEFFDGKNYIQEELARLNHLFRDYRANKVKRTNSELRERGSGVAKHSYHTLGQAMDFHIEGVQLANIRKAALKMRAGGVGYYPRSNFVHIDTGPVRNW